MKRFSVPLRYGLLISLVSASVAHARNEVRDWPDINGTPTFKATLVRFMPESGEARLRRDDGTVVDIGLRDMGPKALAQLRKLEPGTRAWTTPNGGQIEATLLNIETDKILLWWKNGVLDVPWTRLGEADRKYVESVALDRVGKRTIKLERFDSFGNHLGHGSAFYIADGWLVTNYHVIRGITRLETDIAGKPQTIGQCVAVDRANDLAILKCDAAKELDPPLQLQGGLPAIGDDLWAVGFPQGLRNSSKGNVGNLLKTKDFPKQFRDFLQEGQIARKHVPFQDNTQWVQIEQAVILPGSSGGPLVNTSGEVVGINTWVSVGGFGQAVHVQHLVDLLKVARQQNQPESLPLPPVDGEPTMGWWHPNVAALLQAGGDPRPQLLGLGQRLPKQWEGLQSLIVTILRSANDPNGNRWIQPAANLVLNNHIGDPVTAQLALNLCGASPTAVGDYCKSLIQHPQARNADRSAASLGLMGHLLRRLEEAQGQTQQQLQPLRAEIDAAKADWRNRFAGEQLKALVVGGQLQLSHQKQFIDPPLFLQRSALEEFTALQKGNPQAVALDLSYAGVAKHLDYYLNNLGHGAAAPNFGGENLKGHKVALRGLKGQVVLLDFFADWCPFCVNMYPLEKKLHAHYQKRAKGKFTLVGVTNDNLARIQTRVDNKQITWPVCFDKPPQGQDSVMKIYRVDSFPTLILLDKKGVVRYRWDQGLPPNKAQELFNAIDKLLRE